MCDLNPEEQGADNRTLVLSSASSYELVGSVRPYLSAARAARVQLKKGGAFYLFHVPQRSQSATPRHLVTITADRIRSGVNPTSI